MQLWGHNDGAELSNVRVLFTSLAASNRDDDAASTLPASAWSYKQQMYVHCNFTGLYQCNEDLVTGTWNSTTMGDAPWEAGHFVNYKYQRWPNCNPGWYPDPLMDVSPGVGIPRIPKGATQPIFLEVCVPTTQVRRSMHQGCLLKPRNLVFYPFFTHFPPSFAQFQRLDARNPGSTARSPGENGKIGNKIVENRGN